MKDITAIELAGSFNGELLTGNKEIVIDGVSTDSRSVNVGDVFFALKGENFDGHEYIDEGIKRGCRVFVVSDNSVVNKAANNNEDVTFVLCGNTLKALQLFAKYYKNIISPITIAVTGSVGKTSLKDMLNIIAGDNFNTVCSVGNENNHIGVPKTIFRMEENTEVLILEMGMNHKNEISLLVDIGTPDIAAITNIGVSHLENFDDQSQIFESKMEITENFTKDNTLVVNGDDNYLRTVKGEKKYSVLSAGVSGNNDYIVSDAKYLNDTEITFLIEYDNGVERFTLPVAGLYNSVTAGLAVAVMSKLNVSVGSCAHSLQKMSRTPNRLQLINKDGIKIIDDSYNASPDSMKSGIDYLLAVEAKRRIAVLGDMKELGEQEIQHHTDVGEYAGKSGIDYVFTVGDLAFNIGKRAGENIGDERVFSYKNKDDCLKKLKQFLREGDVILVKGSNSMKMSQIVDEL